MATTTRFYYDAAIAVALTSALPLGVALISAIVVSRVVARETPSVTAGLIVLALIGPLLLWRLWRGWRS